MTSSVRALLTLMLTLASLPAWAQQTTGSIIGRVVDQQSGAVPGVSVTATSLATGFVRTGTTDGEGLYRLTALPVGTYDVVAELAGFTRLELKEIVVNISRTTDLSLTIEVAREVATVTVTGQLPLISTTSSSVGEVVDLGRVEGLPLNGRQFANLAATVPGVGLGFHSDTTKGLQYTPQISGGNGRNVNYVVDGGDNNDDTVGGLLQLYPLEAIQEFNVITQRFNAEYGRSDGGVLNLVTRSGTNAHRGSWFTLFRDDSLNARTFSEEVNRTAKQPYRRYQFGGSFGGPIVLNKVHYFAAYERTQQDTQQVVNTLGLFPDEDGIYKTPLRETLFTGKVTVTATDRQYLSLRYGFDENSQPNGAGLRAAPSAWSTSTNKFQSMNANHNWVLGNAQLNELVLQYSTFKNDIPASSSEPYLQFPNGVTAGSNPSTPQITEQKKWQLRDELSWSVSRFGGLAHDFKAGVSLIHEPRLFALATGGSNGVFTMGSNDINGPVVQVAVLGGTSAANIPLDLYGLYVQDDWRVTSRLTFNLGVRWDYVSGMPINQDSNPNFVALQAAGQTGRFAGTALDDFGKSPRGDKDNIQPRLGFALDLRGDGRDVIRGGWGIYTDFAYTNANALTPAIDANGGSGIVFQADDASGLRKSDGSLFHASDPISSIASLNTVNTSVPPLVGMVLSPRIEQPYTFQTNLGWSHQLNSATAINADYVRVPGRDLNLRLRTNMRVNGVRYLSGIALQPNNSSFRVAISKGESLYQALTLSMRRRMSGRVDASAWYTLSSSVSNIGSASDELDLNLVQNVLDPFGPVQDAPSVRTDARHRVSVTAIVRGPWDVQIAPVVQYRTGLPVQTSEGRDFNGDGNNNDITAKAYKYTGLNDDGTARYEEAGACQTVNCSRRAPFSQVNLRVSRSFGLGRNTRIEAITEVFNMFNARNPFIPVSTQRLSTSGTALGSFMQPTAFAGDFQQPEQRVGQIGVRLTF